MPIQQRRRGGINIISGPRFAGSVSHPQNGESCPGVARSGAQQHTPVDEKPSGWRQAFNAGHDRLLAVTRTGGAKRAASNQLSMDRAAKSQEDRPE
jgi:hypothetical protein